SDHFLLEVDDSFETQFGSSSEASSAASLAIDNIESTIIDDGASLRYSKDVYLAFRDYLLSYKFAAEDMYNSVLGESTVANVYFTNAADDEGTHHPFMVIASHNSPSGPQFLIDVARPPGDNCCEGGYPEQNITRNAVLEVKLVKIPLRDYGLISNLTDNDLSPYGTLASDMNLSENEWTTDNYASLNSSAIAVDGVLIYPASNNVLVYATYAAEITSSGIHVGRGMGFHYHADGHSFNGNGTNLYNLSDFDGHTHPPIIGFAFDGVALFGKYESSYNSMDGFGIGLDEYNGHDHDDYGYHYHAFATEVTQAENNSSETYIQHFLFRGAFKGSVNDIPGLFEVSTNQFMNEEIKRYVGAAGTVMDIDKLSQYPQSFNLSQNYPNPFNPSTSIDYDVENGGQVELAIYDLTGKQIRTLVSDFQSVGRKVVQWNGTNDVGIEVSSGIYFYQIQVNGYSEMKKMMFLK
ncbi:MAG: T9SS type A sorting domain-containing protein, partial [Candidatus Marinimicrobia bacterium]|nr:T9SS type A sorting domain-containing protein [Candidatus Neomarinimicrobiota bacterium]MBT3998333.1 T9SS type A sorting domain-containing protein [Candidatus Neomarinimicrobiota bacterium]MBT4579988.1 T9SS type A sorting domain-containing protein [Candidatus Neomarinimicrobiota bacterium]MBT6632741.1 T9SS type A sorting domain-containing protein [Candidatus Neomarinimicrobiota bacterium]MBT6862861.1 T9SS type A sorting domain-containing protein [Candidatus Neomarinimicrobiota bacterium]